MIRRMFWHCLIMETYVKIELLILYYKFSDNCRCLNLEFNIPSTGLNSLEELVGLPDFSTGDFSEEDYISNQASHFQEHFASQIVLRRLSVEFNATLNDGKAACNCNFTLSNPTHRLFFFFPPSLFALCLSRSPSTVFNGQ